MSYLHIEQGLLEGRRLILDGGPRSELSRRGALIHPLAWCGSAALDRFSLLEAIHRDYIAAGTDVITTNTFASSRLMLEADGLADCFEDINRRAVESALSARMASGRSEVVVAGSLSHMIPSAAGSTQSGLAQAPSQQQMADAFAELAGLLAAAGCDLILLEMMYHPDRIRPAFEAASATGLPIWAGFSARRGAWGQVLAFAPDSSILFEETVRVLEDFDVAAAGVMHSASDVVSKALRVLFEASVFGGPLMACADEDYFKMPNWRFGDPIPRLGLKQLAKTWVGGVQIIGGSGLSLEQIAGLARTVRLHEA